VFYNRNNFLGKCIEQTTNLPAFLTNPASARMSSHISHLKHSGCQFPFIALITLPMMYSPQPRQHGA